MGLFVAKTRDEEAGVLRQQAPSDKIFNTKNIEGSNLFKLFKALAFETTRLDEIISEYWQGTDLLTTQNEDYIKLWEGFVGIPDDVFLETITLSLDERRSQILVKLLSLGVLTEQDFIDLAFLLGYVIEIRQGEEYLTFPITFPITFAKTSKAVKFTMAVNLPSSLAHSSSFPLTFPFTFSEGTNLIEILFKKLKPANTVLIFNYIL